MYAKEQSYAEGDPAVRENGASQVQIHENEDASSDDLGIGGDLRLNSTPNDFNMDTLVSYIDNGDIRLPFYQRNYTWDIYRASRLVESLIMGLPVPQVFLYAMRDGGHQILDGQQRLLSIYFFRKGRFPTDISVVREAFSEAEKVPENALKNGEHFRDFKLKFRRQNGHHNPLDGTSYDELPAKDRSYFNSRTIRTTVINIWRSAYDDASEHDAKIYELYHRLNTGGVILKPQEVRANLYASKFYNMLYEVNKDQNWRKLLGLDDLDKFMKDIEILLRAVSLLVWGEKYASPMVKFLNDFSGYAKNDLDNDDIGLIREILRRFISEASALPGRPFDSKQSKRFSVSLFEAAFVARSAKLWSEKNPTLKLPTIAANQLDKIRGDKEFLDTLLRGSNSKDNVSARLKIAKSRMEASC